MRSVLFLAWARLRHRPARWLLVALGMAGPTLDPGLHLVVVGRAVRTDPLLFSGTFDPGHDAPVLVADGVVGVAGIDPLSLFQRSYGWVAPIDLDRVQRLGVDGYLARSAQAPDPERWSTGLVLTAPDDVLRAEDARARRGSAPRARRHRGGRPRGRRPRAIPRIGHSGRRRW